MADEAKLRLFTALQLPDSWRGALSKVRAELEKVASGELKLVRPESMHLTLVFLGYQRADSLSAVIAALESAASTVRPFSLSLGQPGYFGPPHGLRVVWMGLKDSPPQLSALHAAIASRLHAGGIPFDQKPLVPHITLARGRSPMDRAASLRVHATLQRLRLSPEPAMVADRFVLMQSRLSPAGPEYQVVQSFPLGRTAAEQPA